VDKKAVVEVTLAGEIIADAVLIVVVVVEDKQVLPIVTTISQK